MHVVPLLKKLWNPFSSFPSFLSAVRSLSYPCLSYISVSYCLSSSSFPPPPLPCPLLSVAHHSLSTVYVIYHVYKRCALPPHVPALLLILFSFLSPLSRILAVGGPLCLTVSNSGTSTSKMHVVPLLKKLWNPFSSFPSFLSAVRSLSYPCLSYISVSYCLSSSSFPPPPLPCPLLSVAHHSLSTVCGQQPMV